MKNGIICEMDAESLANALAGLLQNESLQKDFSLHLSKESLGSEAEINTFYQLINGSN
jgi:hypothetical protein